MAAYNKVKEIHYKDVSCSVQLKELILNKLIEPVIFKGYLDKKWSDPLTWSPRVIAGKLSSTVTSFKVCPKEETMQYNKLLTNDSVIYETNCQYIEATFEEFSVWLNSEEKEGPESNNKRHHSDNPFASIRRSDYWVYADYKYMSQLCPPDIITAIDWSLFGFESRNGNESSLWIGSEGANTPCHYDTYGCNLVAQLWGTKQWTLFHPNDSLYPTRIPYEESSVFSRVNVKSPQTDLFPDFSKAKPYKVILYPGDVLYVPHHWWHYVECLEPSVSVNTWIDLPQDKEERIKEGLVRLLVSNFITQDNKHSFLNPNETIFPVEDNLVLLNTLLQQDSSQQQQTITLTDIINVMTSEQVLSIMKENLLK